MLINCLHPKTKPGEIRLLLKSSVGFLPLIFLSLFSLFILPLWPIGIKWLVKLCKHLLPYRGHACINSECVCVCVSVSEGVCEHIYACLTVLYLHWCLKSLWVRDTGSRLLCTLSTFTSLFMNTSVCVCLSLPVCICIYITLCMPACAVGLCAFSFMLWISLPVFHCVFTYSGCFISQGFGNQRMVLWFTVTITTCRYNEAKKSAVTTMLHQTKASTASYSIYSIIYTQT